MTSFADDFRTEAKQKPGEIVFRRLSGWSFGLSYGAVRPELVAQAVERAGFRLKAHGRGDVTDEVLARLRAVGDQLVQPEKEWLFSAKLQPPERSSTEADWKFLGSMCAALQVPIDSLITPFEMTNPNATHYWSWTEGAS
jgi:hypothetical protein